MNSHISMYKSIIVYSPHMNYYYFFFNKYVLIVMILKLVSNMTNRRAGTTKKTCA